MLDAQLFHQPTLRQLLNSEALAEAQVLYGDDLIDRPVVQVVASLTPAPRAGSLAVCRMETLVGLEAAALDGLSALVIIKQSSSESLPPITPSSTAVPQPAPLGLGIDVALKRITKLCSDEEIPLILIPGFGDSAQIAEDVRIAFLRELKLSSARLHSALLSLLLDEGLDGVVEEISNRLNRPVVIETADFKVLASRNMGATPASQQRMLAEEASKAMRRRFSSHEKLHNQDIVLSPLKVGRRLVLPILLSDALVGFIAVMVRPNDDTEMISEYLQAAALAAMVEFSQRRRDGSVFTVTQQSLLKDLLTGNTLSASDQERFERHYGFDLCDGLLMFAVESAATRGGATKSFSEDGFASTEIEGTRVFVVPFFEKSGTTWQIEAQNLAGKIKEFAGGTEKVKVQIGASRTAQTILDLPEAYREARQALIIGSMVNGDNDFIIGYGELGIKRLLYLMIDHPELDRFYEENLAPLEAYDTEWESELVESLRVYLEQGANLNSAARALFIHRHTLRYRLEQIADILKVDIDSQEVLLNLQIAFLIRDMKNNVRGKGRP
ncbi:MAG: helix-turn-helix domain-containing protein [Cyanobacteria bacterium SZAS-4]|nr:helix-turn-helix domain-containing protein [Cyanobacteria bacterium SZAS-4]